MKIECMSKLNLEYTIKQKIRELKKDSILKIEITPCEVLKGTFDLEISENQASTKSEGKDGRRK